MVTSSSAPDATSSPNDAISCMILRRTNGSPPVRRIFLVPTAMNLLQTMSNSSSVNSSAFGRKFIFSAMQYTQRKSQRSVTETRRYSIGRPNGSIRGGILAVGMTLYPLSINISLAQIELKSIVLAQNYGLIFGRILRISTAVMPSSRRLLMERARSRFANRLPLSSVIKRW